ncbi:Proline iminopeptidase [Legionella birminghamensis]|uniref:Proline iminopeptidase n=1 Tax=Legionella birminghamensis TaxID=28083 RepID=A0A378IA61_9GAMM|nr:alpha/beta hydrolase [Legionella birminghamensis]KTC75991.1 Proline iminopeptidase [Legionella birminghamensis]STX32117.1 Proline iminopeptidase [Legionella birminghamensis]
MKYLIHSCLLLASVMFYGTVYAAICPPPSAYDHYVLTKLRAEKKKDAADVIQIYYKLLSPFNPQKPTLLVINGGPGGDHNLIDLFRGTELDKKMNIVGFDHRGLGCTRFLSPWMPTYEAGIYSMGRAADDIEAIRKDLLGEDGKWFVYGVSYGTMLGQQYAIKYPEHIGGMILDSAFHDSQAINIARQQFMSLYIRGDKTVSDLFDQVIEKYSDLQFAILRTIFNYSYGYDGRTKAIPIFLQQLANTTSRKDARKMIGNTRSLPLTGMSRHIVCEEIWDYPAEQDSNAFYFAPFRDCGVFKKYRNPMAFSEELKKLDIPVFIWGGRYDPVTPIQAMREMHQLIPESLFWEHPYAGHGLIVESSACALKLADMFFSGNSVTEIETLANSKDCQGEPSANFADTKSFLKRMTLPGVEFPSF